MRVKQVLRQKSVTQRWKQIDKDKRDHLKDLDELIQKRNLTRQSNYERSLVQSRAMDQKAVKAFSDHYRSVESSLALSSMKQKEASLIN